MNGDDGYVDAGGGGSVWWELRVSEAEGIEAASPQDTAGHGHRPRRNGLRAFLQRGTDTYTDVRAEDNAGGKPRPQDPPRIADQGDGFFVVTIDDASQIQRIEVDANNALRLYVPIVPRPRGPRVRQVSVRWGLRQGRLIGSLVWSQLRSALLGAGAVDTAVSESVEGKSGQAA